MHGILANGNVRFMLRNCWGAFGLVHSHSSPLSSGLGANVNNGLFCTYAWMVSLKNSIRDDLSLFRHQNTTHIARLGHNMKKRAHDCRTCQAEGSWGHFFLGHAAGIMNDVEDKENDGMLLMRSFWCLSPSPFHNLPYMFLPIAHPPLGAVSLYHPFLSNVHSMMSVHWLQIFWRQPVHNTSHLPCSYMSSRGSDRGIALGNSVAHGREPITEGAPRCTSQCEILHKWCFNMMCIEYATNVHIYIYIYIYIYMS